MTRRHLAFLASVCVFAPAAPAYIRVYTSPGVFISRPDFANVQLLLNENAVPGLRNSDGKIMITPDSDVMGAIAAAMATWNSVPTSAAHFAPIQTTPLLNAFNDGNSVLVFADSPAIRSMLGTGYLTLPITAARGSTILDTDILFNPIYTFSTTGAPNTFDLQSAVTSDLGIVLGAAHSAVVGASLYFDTQPNETVKRILSPEDIAFVSAVYPADGPSPYGTLGGTLTLNGAPLRNALISAVDTGSGAAFSAITSQVDGTWTIAVPPGNYLVFAQPLTGHVVPSNVFVGDLGAVDTNFDPTFFGGNGNQVTVPVTTGATTTADFSASTAGTAPPISIWGLTPAPPGSVLATATLVLDGFSQVTPVVSGGSVDIVIQGQGIDSSLTDSNIVLVGPAILRPGSVRQDQGPPFLINGVPIVNMRFTVDLPAVSAQSYVTLVVSNNGGFASYTGGLVLLPPAP